MKRALTILFVALYVAVGFVSCYHACSYFSMANATWLAIILAIAFELGQAAVLLALLTDKTQSSKTMPWILIGVLTIVQCIGNIFASYQYMIQNSQEQIRYFIDSVMWFMKDPDPQTNIVICAYIIGAILPLIALCMTGMVVGTSGIEHKEVEQAPEPEPESRIFL